MAMSDQIGDMLTRIRNGQSAKLAVIECPSSNFRKHVLEVLVKEGFIRGFNEVQKPEAPPMLHIELKYYEGDAVIKRIDRVSKPGKRVYVKIRNLDRFYNGLGISILSTPRGVMSDNEARAANVGGEVLCRVF